eukprot:c22077_g1_i1.p1 GENE.c22077_g1_i1~~c22077_g1_i1.p1  ORF type:complete len:132 (+),score=33.94 c22077_g1_i1:1-396(+)
MGVFEEKKKKIEQMLSFMFRSLISSTRNRINHPPSNIPVLATQSISLQPSGFIDELPSLSELIGSILFAVPKKKVSHSRKRMKLMPKMPKTIDHFHTCASCGKLKLRHHYPCGNKDCGRVKPQASSDNSQQ